MPNRPQPRFPEPNTEPFWEGAKNGELKYQQCKDCNEIVFYPRLICVGCGGLNLDWKTSKAVYDETALQLAASAFAEFIAGEDGVTEEPLPDGIEWGVTVRLTPDGDYEAVPFRMMREVFDVFLAAKVVAAREPVLRSSRDEALSPSVRREAE